MNNHDYVYHHSESTTTDLQLSPSQGGAGDYFRPTPHPKNPRKKRTKLIGIDYPIGVNSSGSSTSGILVKPKYCKKPDPSAPKITRPCSECGKKFWSWKALFGHMRCHPERQWRGINPPPNIRKWPAAAEIAGNVYVETGMTEEDHEVAACLLMLSNSPTIAASTCTDHALLESDSVVRDVNAGGGDVTAGGGDVVGGFECSSCKKVFGSHQALGGHRATHKNVKGCFAITRSNQSEEVNYHHINSCNLGYGVDEQGEVRRDNGEEKTMMVVWRGHKCSICSRVFSSGQALGGHKRCHWERGDHEPSSSSLITAPQGLNPSGTTREEGGCCGGLDLNLPAPVEDDCFSSYSSGLALDLRLGL